MPKNELMLIRVLAMWFCGPSLAGCADQAPRLHKARRRLAAPCLAVSLIGLVPGPVVAATASATVDPKAPLSQVLSTSVKPVELPPVAPANQAATTPATQAEIDLLLEMQLEDRDWGATPADAPASGPQQVTVDVRSLSPGLPPNPAFPGYGLSYEAPLFPPKATLDLPPRAGQAGAPGTSGPQHWARRTASWFGLEPDAEGREQIGAFRQWVAGHRVALLGGLGVVAIAAAAMLAFARPAGRRQAGAAPAKPRRRRRSGSSSRHHRSPPP